jgi:linear primary-alkylsulfatase
MKQITSLSLVALAAAALAGCGRDGGIGGTSGDATAATLQANAQFAQTLQLDDKRALEDAKRGFIARPEGKIVGADGNVLIDFDAFKFVEGPAPSTVNPSLWRHAQLNAQVGLFKVTDGIYQLHGFDKAPGTFAIVTK